MTSGNPPDSDALLNDAVRDVEAVIASLKADIAQLASELSEEKPQRLETIRQNFQAIAEKADAVFLIPLCDYTENISGILGQLWQGKAFDTVDLLFPLQDTVVCLESFLREAKGEAARDEVLIDKNLADFRNCASLDEGDDKIFRSFLQDAEEIISGIESAILAIEQQPEDAELVNQIFRGFHSLKGGAGGTRLKALSGYAHQVETLLSKVRDGHVSVTPELASGLLTSVDCLRSLLAEAKGDASLDQNLINDNLAGLKALSATPPTPVDEPDEIDRILASIGDGNQATSDLQEEANGPDQAEKEIEDSSEKATKTAIQEVGEVTDSLRAGILTLEKGTGDSEAINRIFRGFQTIKDTAERVFLIPLHEYAHDVKNTLSAVRDGQVPITADLVNLLLGSIDCLRSFLAEAKGEKERDEAGIEKNLAGFRRYADPAMPSESDPAPAEIPETASAPETAPSPVVEETPAADTSMEDMLKGYMQGAIQEAEEIAESLEATILALENQPDDAELINTIFRCYHTIKGGAGLVGLSDLAASLIPTTVENAMSKVREGTVAVSPDLVSLLLESIDCLNAFLGEAKGEGARDQAMIARNLAAIQAHAGNPSAVSPPVLTAEDSPQPVGEILVQQKAASPADVREGLKKQKQDPLGQVLVQEGKVTPQNLDKALSTQDR